MHSFPIFDTALQIAMKDAPCTTAKSLSITHIVTSFGIVRVQFKNNSATNKYYKTKIVEEMWWHSVGQPVYIFFSSSYLLCLFRSSSTWWNDIGIHVRSVFPVRLVQGLLVVFSCASHVHIGKHFLFKSVLWRGLEN